MHPQGTTKAPASSLTTRAVEADRDRHPGTVKAIRGGRRAGKKRGLKKTAMLMIIFYFR